MQISSRSRIKWKFKKKKTAKPYRYGNHKNKREILDTIFYKDSSSASKLIQIEKQDHLLGKMRAAEKCRLVLGAELSGNSKKKKLPNRIVMGTTKTSEKFLTQYFTRIVVRLVN